MSEAEEIRDKADEILSRPEYQPPTRSVLDRAFDWVIEQVFDVLGRLGSGSGSWVIGWLALGLLLAAAGWMLWRVMPRRRLRAVAKDTTPETSTRERISREQWLEHAAKAEAEGNWPEAVRGRWRATVAGLLDRSEVVSDEGATSGELQRSFTAEADRRTPFSDATERFENVWYGGAEADAADVGELGELDRRVLDDQR